MIHFECDYLEGCHPSILRKLEETNSEQTLGYGEDPHCEHAREMIRLICDAPHSDVHFLVGGTQTNVTVISSILRPHQAVVCASSGHINVHETGAVEHSGHKVIALPATCGKISADQIRAAFEGHFTDPNAEHMAQPAMVYISYSTEFGTIYSKRELLAIKQVCSDWEAPLFIDGARLGYGLESSKADVLLKDIAAIADVFYIGGTKQGALFGEAVVITDDALKKDFRYHIKQNGGMLAKGRLLGIQFEALMEGGLYFKLARTADRLAERIASAFRDAGFPFLEEGCTNQVFPVLPNDVAAELSKDFGYEQWQIVDETHTGVRFCTSWATTPEQVDTLVDAISRIKSKH